MPEYQVFIFPSVTQIQDMLVDVVARIAKKRQYLSKVQTGPAVYGKSPADIALLERKLESLEALNLLLLGMMRDAEPEPETSEYLIPGSRP